MYNKNMFTTKFLKKISVQFRTHPHTHIQTCLIKSFICNALEARSAHRLFFNAWGENFHIHVYNFVLYVFCTFDSFVLLLISDLYF